MVLEGTLELMSLPTLVQAIAQEGGQIHIQVRRDEAIGSLYFSDGRLNHAVLEAQGQTFTGEEVIYALLAWQSGAFIVRKDSVSTEQTIDQHWNHLLVEGLRRLDEGQLSGFEDSLNSSNEESLSEMLADLSAEDAAEIATLMQQQEIEMATKSEQLQSVLSNMVANSNDINGAAIISSDGLMMASVVTGGVDGDRVAAVSAGLVSLAGRSAQQLQQGEIKQVLIQAAEGNIMAVRANDNVSMVALTATGANLGMVFFECQDAVSTIRGIV